MIELGVTARDIVTGIEGVVTGRAQYLTGCDQYVIQPKSKDNQHQSAQWFDENRLQVLTKIKKIVIEKTDDGKTGGPISNPAPTK